MQKYHTRGVYGGGLRVRTTIDLKLQKIARDAIAKVLPPEIGPTAALVTLDAHTGAVLAMVGGRNYHQSQFNLATQGERQPGSSFKPFVLAAALKSGISPATTLVSQPVTIDAGGRLWKVNNYEGDYIGTIDLRQAIAYSDNSVFAQLTNIVGPANVAATAKALGIATPLNGRTSRSASAASRRRRSTWRARTRRSRTAATASTARSSATSRASSSASRTTTGTAQKDNAIDAHRVLEDWQAATDRPAPRRASSATAPARRRTSAATPVAGKTGTTENYGDAWFVGYTPDIVTAVWVGYPDELRPMLTEYHGRPVAGGTYPALIWKAFMEKALPYRQAPSRARSPQPSFPYASPQQRRPPRREAPARQRQLQRHDHGAALLDGAARDRGLRARRLEAAG